MFIMLYSSKKKVRRNVESVALDFQLTKKDLQASEIVQVSRNSNSIRSIYWRNINTVIVYFLAFLKFVYECQKKTLKNGLEWIRLLSNQIDYIIYIIVYHCHIVLMSITALWVISKKALYKYLLLFIIIYISSMLGSTETLLPSSWYLY